MSSVAEILANLKSQALVGATGAADDNARLMRYLNKGYKKVYRRVARRYPWLYRQSQTVIITAGVGTLSPQFYDILSVRDAGNGYVELEHRSVEAIEKESPELTATGAPTSYDRQGLNGITCYPKNDTTVRVRGISNPADLTDNSLEEHILLPVLHHDVLEWATLWIIAYDERDKLVGSELQFTAREFDDGLTDLYEYLDGQAPDKERRTKAVLA